MKISIIGPQFPWQGGIAKYLDMLGDALQNRTYDQEHSVSRITFTRQYPRLFRKEQRVIRDFLPFCTWLRIDMLNPFLWPKVESQKADLVIFKYWHPYFAPCFGYLAKKFKKEGSKIYFIVDNVLPHEWFPMSRLLAEYCLSNGNLFITHSKRVTDELIKLVPTAFVKETPHPSYDYGKKISVAHARRKLDLPAITNWRTRPIILFFGYIRPYKGLDTLLHAFAMLQGWKDDGLLLVAGEPFENMTKYKALADALGIYDKIIWHDEYIPEEQVHLYFSAADLLVLSYKETTQSGIAEIARSFDLPVIATDTGGLSKQVKATIPPNDPQALYKMMVEFFTDNLDCGFKQKATTFDDLAKEILCLMKKS